MGWLREQFDRPRHILPAGDHPLALQCLEVADHSVGRADLEGGADLANRGAVASGVNLVADEGIDLHLPLGRSVFAVNDIGRLSQPSVPEQAVLERRHASHGCR